MTEYCRNCYQPIRFMQAWDDEPGHWAHEPHLIIACSIQRVATPSDHINCGCPDCTHPCT